MKGTYERLKDVAQNIETQQERKKKNKELYKSRKQLLENFFSTDEGKEVLIHIAHICGYYSPSIAIDSNGKVCPNSTVALSAKRDVFLELKRSLSIDVIQEFEKRNQKYLMDQDKRYL